MKIIINKLGNNFYITTEKNIFFNILVWKTKYEGFDYFLSRDLTNTVDESSQGIFNCFNTKVEFKRDIYKVVVDFGYVWNDNLPLPDLLNEIKRRVSMVNQAFDKAIPQIETAHIHL